VPPLFKSVTPGSASRVASHRSEKGCFSYVSTSLYPAITCPLVAPHPSHDHAMDRQITGTLVTPTVSIAMDKSVVNT